MMMMMMTVILLLCFQWEFMALMLFDADHPFHAFILHILSLSLTAHSARCRCTWTLATPLMFVSYGARNSLLRYNYWALLSFFSRVSILVYLRCTVSFLSCPCPCKPWGCHHMAAQFTCASAVHHYRASRTAAAVAPSRWLRRSRVLLLLQVRVVHSMDVLLIHDRMLSLCSYLHLSIIHFISYRTQSPQPQRLRVMQRARARMTMLTSPRIPAWPSRVQAQTVPQRASSSRIQHCCHAMSEGIISHHIPLCFE
jgi:hypothetical protein